MNLILGILRALKFYNALPCEELGRMLKLDFSSARDLFALVYKECEFLPIQISFFNQIAKIQRINSNSILDAYACKVEIDLPIDFSAVNKVLAENYRNIANVTDSRANQRYVNQEMQLSKAENRDSLKQKSGRKTFCTRKMQNGTRSGKKEKKNSFDSILLESTYTQNESDEKISKLDLYLKRKDNSNNLPEKRLKHAKRKQVKLTKFFT